MIRAAVAWRSRWAEQNKQRERSHRRRLREQKKMQRDFSSNAVGERDDERWRAARGDGREGRRRERRPSARDSLALYREDDVASPPPPPPPRSSKSKSKSPEPEREDANDDDDARRAPGGGRVLGPSRGGLRAGYEQVKVFRDGNSLFHCARLAEIVCQAREKEAAAGASNGSTGTSYTLVPIRPRWRGESRSLRTFAVASLRPPLAFNPRPRRLSTPTDAFQLHPAIRLYRTTLFDDARRGFRRRRASTRDAVAGEVAGERDGDASATRRRGEDRERGGGRGARA